MAEMPSVPSQPAPAGGGAQPETADTAEPRLLPAGADHDTLERLLGDAFQLGQLASTPLPQEEVDADGQMNAGDISELREALRSTRRLQTRSGVCGGATRAYSSLT